MNIQEVQPQKFNSYHLLSGFMNQSQINVTGNKHTFSLKFYSLCWNLHILWKIIGLGLAIHSRNELRSVASGKLKRLRSVPKNENDWRPELNTFSGSAFKNGVSSDAVRSFLKPTKIIVTNCVQVPKILEKNTYRKMTLVLTLLWVGSHRLPPSHYIDCNLFQMCPKLPIRDSRHLALQSMRHFQQSNYIFVRTACQVNGNKSGCLLWRTWKHSSRKIIFRSFSKLKES